MNPECVRGGSGPSGATPARIPHGSAMGDPRRWRSRAVPWAAPGVLGLLGQAPNAVAGGGGSAVPSRLPLVVGRQPAGGALAQDAVGVGVPAPVDVAFGGD